MNSRDLNILLLLFTSFFFENWNVLEYRYNFLSDWFGEKKKKKSPNPITCLSNHMGFNKKRKRKRND